VFHEFRLFCDENNQDPPAPLRAAPARDGLTYWFAGDPALQSEQESVSLKREEGRTVFFQRVLYDIRYELLDEAGRSMETGTVADLLAGLELARAWLSGARWEDLAVPRSPIL
jgi:hypothetical protein